MDWHLVYAIEMEICSDGSLDHHPVEAEAYHPEQGDMLLVEVITFF